MIQNKIYCLLAICFISLNLFEALFCQSLSDVGNFPVCFDNGQKWIKQTLFLTPILFNCQKCME